MFAAMQYVPFRHELCDHRRARMQVHERREAKEGGYESPIHETAQDTHANYNRCVRILIQEAATANAEVRSLCHFPCCTFFSLQDRLDRLLCASCRLRMR
jgi:Proline dehydrogenase